MKGAGLGPLNCTPEDWGQGNLNGSGADVRFEGPEGIAVDNQRTIYEPTTQKRITDRALPLPSPIEFRRSY
jgi:hypothetical protein